MTDTHQATHTAVPPDEDEVQQSHLTFPVVGIGASAGGLHALRLFLEHMPSDSGMAFVIILHLSPEHESHVDRILQTATKMPCIQVRESTPIELNHVYVISPAQQLRMSDGHLHVTQQVRPRGRQIAVDVFFRTLADAHRHHAVSILLSGTGSDGGAGMARIKEQGGITIAQALDDAEYDGMPANAIAKGLVDIVLPVADMPQKLIDLWSNARAIQLPRKLPDLPAETVISPDQAQRAEQALSDILSVLHTKTGHDFRQYKRATVIRRVERRLQVLQLTTLPDYQRHLREHPEEASALLSDMLIGVTNFFRDREAFEALEREVLPQLIADCHPAEGVRVWSAGCCTGEEAYSLAMILHELAREQTTLPELHIFATDIDEASLAIARNGSYPESVVADVPPARLRHFFAKQQDRYRVKANIREKVLFASHNMLRDPPFSKLDLITCRNLLIYLNRDVQAQVLRVFHFALRPGGYLFLGNSESADTVPELFSPVNKKQRIYRANPVAHRRFTPTMPLGPQKSTVHTGGGGEDPQDGTKILFAALHQNVLEQYAPPSVIVNNESDIVHISDQAGKFLRYVAGEPSHNLLTVVLPELRLELRTALYQAGRYRKSIEARRVKIKSPDGDDTYVNMIVRPFHDDRSNMDFMLVVFDEVEDTLSPEAKGDSARTRDPALEQLEDELQRTKRQLQDTIEDAETTVEELKAANEELQAINEELRSTSEELETSKEELQSMNEELMTVNHELKVNVDEMGKVNDDLQNLVASTDIATVFVDRATHIKRYTPRALDIFSIIPGDVGRSLFDINHCLEYESLADDAAQVFETLLPIEREVRSVDGRYYLARIVPYRTSDDRIEGAVLAFIDITARRQMEELLHAEQDRMRLVAESTKDYAILTLDTEGVINSWNQAAERVFGWTEQEALGQSWTMIFTTDDQKHGAPQDEMRRARVDGRAEDERWHVRKDGSRIYCLGVTNPLYDGTVYGYAKIARDWTERKRREEEREQQIRAGKVNVAEAVAESHLKDEFLAVMSHELKHPLNLIHIQAELLARFNEVRQSPHASKAVAAISRSVTSQARIIDDLLDLSRLHTGKLQLDRGPVDWAATVNTIVESVRATSIGMERSIIVKGTEDRLIVDADAVRVEQIVHNLMSNAVKFTRSGDRIEVDLRRDGDFAVLEISDTGQGIPREFLPHIFDMFKQVDGYTTRSQGGLGIGLSMVRELADAHGGRVEGHSDGVRQGACFRIWLPLYAKQPGVISADYETSLLNGIRMLLVDDAVDSLESFSMLLEMEGAVVVTATSAKAALQLAADEDYDLIVSDVGMPEVDGYALMRELRRLPRHAQTPAIALTGFSRPADVQQAIKAGFAAHLTKPVGLDTFVRTIESIRGSRDNNA